MVYRKIAETCQGYEVLERLTEEEIAAYYRNKKNRKKKEDRQAEVGAWIGSAMMVGFFVFLVLGYMAGI